MMDPYPLSSRCTAWAGPASGKRITWRLAPSLALMCRSCLAGRKVGHRRELHQWESIPPWCRTTLQHARLYVIDRCGHLPMVEKPETFHRLLYDFLLGVEEEIPDVVKI
jgi:hypothetical protein